MLSECAVGSGVSWTAGPQLTWGLFLVASSGAPIRSSPGCCSKQLNTIHPPSPNSRHAFPPKKLSSFAFWGEVSFPNPQDLHLLPPPLGLQKTPASLFPVLTPVLSGSYLMPPFSGFFMTHQICFSSCTKAIPSLTPRSLQSTCHSPEVLLLTQKPLTLLAPTHGAKNWPSTLPRGISCASWPWYIRDPIVPAFSALCIFLTLPSTPVITHLSSAFTPWECGHCPAGSLPCPPGAGLDPHWELHQYVLTGWMSEINQFVLRWEGFWWVNAYPPHTPVSNYIYLSSGTSQTFTWIWSTMQVGSHLVWINTKPLPHPSHPRLLSLLWAEATFPVCIKIPV